MRAWIAAGATLGSMLVLALACGDDPDPTSTPDAASSTDAATPDSATAASDGSTNPPPPSGPIDPAVAARAAIFLATCLSDDGVNRTLQQIYFEHTTNWFRSRAIIECLASKTNGCKALTDCLGFAYTGDAGPCDAGCSGTLYKECSPPIGLFVECSVLGLSCGPKKYCSPPGTETCNPTSFPASCDNGIPVGCEEELTVRGPRCSEYGTECQTGHCRGTGGACMGTTITDSNVILFEGQRCENGKLIACANDGLATVDCATVGKGFSCFDAPDGGANATAYCGTAAECSPKSPWSKVSATCAGTKLVHCNGGKIDEVDCLALGFTGCNQGLCTPGFL